MPGMVSDGLPSDANCPGKETLEIFVGSEKVSPPSFETTCQRAHRPSSREPKKLTCTPPRESTSTLVNCTPVKLSSVTKTEVCVKVISPALFRLTPIR